MVTIFYGAEGFFEGANNISSFFMLKHEGLDVLFYTETTDGENGPLYSIKNSHPHVFPVINNAYSINIIPEGLGYRVHYDFEGSIYTCFWKNYTEKPVLKDWNGGQGNYRWTC